MECKSIYYWAADPWGIFICSSDFSVCRVKALGHINLPFNNNRERQMYAPHNQKGNCALLLPAFRIFFCPIPYSLLTALLHVYIQKGDIDIM